MIKPLISEKSLGFAKQNKFCFICDNQLSRVEIAKIIKHIYKVDVIRVNRLVRKGKVKNTRHGPGKRNDFSVAIVSVKKGQKITGFEFPEKSSENEEKKPVKKELLK